MPGRRVPTKLKIVRGNPGKRALPKAEPQPKQAPMRPPAELDKLARKHWRGLLRAYGPVGLITIVDCGGLAMLCTLYSRWMQAEVALQKSGIIIRTIQGNLIQNPLLGIANRAQAEYRRWCTEFGLTPVARTRLSVPEQTSEDEFSQFLRKTGTLNEDETDDG